jgi:hypothetical protein
MRHRKEINDVTDAEFNIFALALNKLKSDGTWAHISKVHAASDRQHYGTHMDPRTFLPWHRKFFVEVENRLQIAASQLGYSDMEACAVTIPYWNWALDYRDFDEARVWDNDRLGSMNSRVNEGDMDDRMCVTTGRFGKGAAGSEFGKPGSTNPFNPGWFGLEGCTTSSISTDSCRERLSGLNNHGQWDQHVPCGTDAAPRDCSDCILRHGSVGMYRPPTMTYAQILTSLKEDASYQGVANFEEMANFIENQLHNIVHAVIGGNWVQGTSPRYGHMMSMYSPYDPVFFFHHGFIDNLWSKWQDVHVTAKWRTSVGNDAHLLNNLLWDGNSDTFPTSDITMNMDIKDDNPYTSRTETACVKYHDRQTVHACGDRWTEIQQCFNNLVEYEKLHTVPRIRVMTEVGDVCDPINDAHFDTDRMWLETMVAAGMMQANQVDQVLAWERNQLERIENTTETLDASEADDCDKSLCFSATKMLQICNTCQSQGWSLDCHCSLSQRSTTCWESRN